MAENLQSVVDRIVPKYIRVGFKVNVEVQLARTLKCIIFFFWIFPVNQCSETHTVIISQYHAIVWKKLLRALLSYHEAHVNYFADLLGCLYI